MEATDACRALLPEIDQDHLGDIQIVLAEVLNNIAEHAFANRRTEIACLCLSPQGNSLRATMMDCGHPLPGLALPEGKLPDMGETVDDLPEGGFGWYLVHTLCSSIHYERIADVNRLTLDFKRPDQASAAAGPPAG